MTEDQNSLHQTTVVTEPMDFHTIEIEFRDLAERDQVLAEIQPLLNGRGHVSFHTWTALPGEIRYD